MNEFTMKMKVKTSLIVFVMMMASVRLLAQVNPQTDSLTWQYDRIYNGKNQHEFSSAGTLLSYGGTKVEWVQNDYVQSFTVTGVSGQWNDVNANGNIQFAITWGQSTGTLTFTRTVATLTAELNLTNPGRAPSYFKFFLTTVTHP